MEMIGDYELFCVYIVCIYIYVIYIYIYKVGPQFVSVQLVNITPISLWFMVKNKLVTGGYVHQLIAFGGSTL